MEQIYAGIDAVIENMGDLISKYRASLLFIRLHFKRRVYITNRFL
jgi:hypothetical protein